MLKRLLSISFFTIFSIAILISCNGNDVGPCSCPENAPFSVPGSNNCYVSPIDCELAEGEVCEVCLN